MPHINIAKTNKQQLIWMDKHYCKHGMRYLEHQNCWFKDHPDTERVGYLDIETSNLAANFGIVLCACIKVKGEDTIYSEVINKKDLATHLDKRVVERTIKNMSKFDRIIGFYSSRFDMPFLRTRAIAQGIPFPEYGDIIHNDVYFAARSKLRLNSNRLENVSRTLFGTTTKNHIEPDKWIKALMGDAESLSYILDHCERDVIELEKVHEALGRFVKETKTSA